MPHNRTQIRMASREDVPAMLELMRELAVFEGYIDDFAVDESVLRVRGFETDPPDFEVLVAEDQEAGPVGIAVILTVPFTYHAKPALTLKELYVKESWRAHGIGRQLMRAVASLALERDCVSVKWTVADWNDPGIKFYEILGASCDRVWLNYSMDVAAMRNLVRDGD